MRRICGLFGLIIPLLEAVFAPFLYDFSIKIPNFVPKIQKYNERFAISCVCSQNKLRTKTKTKTKNG